MIYKDTLFWDTIPISAHSCIVEKELAVTDSAREWIGVEVKGDALHARMR